MNNNRRNFLKKTSLAGLSLTGIGAISSFSREVKNEIISLAENTEKAGPMDTILLKDWQPSSSVVLTETVVQKAMYPAIDVHSHHYDTSADNIAKRVKNMDEAGLQTAVVLTSATGEIFDKLAGLYLKKYPGRFLLYCGIDTTDIQNKDYPTRVTKELERCYNIGARGLGELHDKGTGFSTESVVNGDKKPDYLHPDDPRLDLLWNKCAELNLPVSLHIADHPSCWKAADAHQERTPNFQSYIQYPNIATSYEELLNIRDRTCKRHPKTTFIFCHLGNQGNDLKELGKSLDSYPNMMLDMSARHYELNRTPRAAAAFLSTYSNRVMFGTDLPGIRSNSMYENYWRLLETADEYVKGPSWWMLYGLNLPASVLEPLYRGNAKRVLNWKV
jgi:predicted TIM-barrel fold metal-dependent hydrolase